MSAYIIIVVVVVVIIITILLLIIILIITIMIGNNDTYIHINTNVERARGGAKGIVLLGDLSASPAGCHGKRPSSLCMGWCSLLTADRWSIHVL